MRILVTGAAGYIGSHLVVALLDEGHHVVALDDFSTGAREALERAQALSGRRCAIVEGDVADPRALDRALPGIQAVIHLAAFKSVGESVRRPEAYFRNNVGGMAALLEGMERHHVRRILYSSTAAVYGSRAPMPLREDATPRPESPYGLSKLQGEQMLSWMSRAKGWNAVSLRYFNPVGAHDSGQIGEPAARAASLVPRALRAIQLSDGMLTVFGTDYDTPDGTCLRDYIHVCDLADAHLTALGMLEGPGHAVYNVGTGRPISVREVLDACARATGRPVPARDGARRPGDVPVAQADPSAFHAATGFVARRTLDEMVESAWRWMTRNPEGYGAAPAGRAERSAIAVGGPWHPLDAAWSRP